MTNIPELTLGIISVSRDCFPITLSEGRRNAVVEAYEKKYGALINCSVTVENEVDMLNAVEEVTARGANALCVFLGNFGPETPETLIAKHFDGPVMYCAAAEEDTAVLKTDRGDAYCGMLNCSYNLGLRSIRAYIPAYPVGTAQGVADMIADFRPVATALLGLKNLKIITFGPRPQDFMACNAPIKPLFDLGVEIRENSELDLLVEYRKHDNDARIAAKVAEMTEELGEGNKIAGILPKLAQYELTLLDIIEQQAGSRKYVALANKCWPAFQTEFGFVPCYVNSRLIAQGIPVSCEVDIYGALSMYVGTCISQEAVTLLDINNTVPLDMYQKSVKNTYDYRLDETFMGFHCGNTPIGKLTKGTMKYHIIMHRGLEPDREPDITRGTLEGDIVPGDITFYRLQSGSEGVLRAYIAHGEVLPVATQSFGGIGVVAIPEMDRFYRHVLIEKRYPHHGAVAFGKHGKALFSLFDILGVGEIDYNRPQSLPYPRENPFA